MHKSAKSGKFRRAIELKYEGMRAKNAVALLNREYPGSPVSLSTFNHWFSKGGVLYEQYAEYAEEVQSTIKQNIRARLLTASELAVDVLTEQVSDTRRSYRLSATAQQAAYKILEYAIGKAKGDEAGNIVVVKLTQPVRPDYVAPGYKPSGEPITTVNEAVAATEQQAKRN